MRLVGHQPLASSPREDPMTTTAILDMRICVLTLILHSCLTYLASSVPRAKGDVHLVFFIRTLGLYNSDQERGRPHWENGWVVHGWAAGVGQLVVNNVLDITGFLRLYMQRECVLSPVYWNFHPHSGICLIPTPRHQNLPATYRRSMTGSPFSLVR
jgi:hypothetical protein